jgi:site-specific DNA-methyltransferase (adenine-specific)
MTALTLSKLVDRAAHRGLPGRDRALRRHGLLRLASGADHVRRPADGGLDLERHDPLDQPASRPRKGGFKQSAEFIVWGVKGSLEKDRDLYLPGHFIASQPRKDRVHITQKPVEIMQKLVQICPEGGTVLDPFTGSGSTGVAALREGRQFVGVELSAHYADVAEARLRAELTQEDFVLAGPEA